MSNLEVEQRICEVHGPYTGMRIVFQGREMHVGVCALCAEEADKRVAARERDRQVRDLRARARIPLRFSNSTLDNFIPTTELQSRALATARDYVGDTELIAAGSCLSFVGLPGTGKTHLLCAMVRALVDANIGATYTTAHEVLAAVRGQWSWSGASDGKVFIGPQVLALDELFEADTAAEREAIVALVDERYQRRRPILLASNLRWKAIVETFGQRMADRLCDGGLVLAFDGPSHRRIRKAT